MRCSFSSSCSKISLFRARTSSFQLRLVAEGALMERGSHSGTCQGEERSRSRNPQMRRWAASISSSILSAGRLIKRDELSARSASNLNRSSDSVSPWSQPTLAFVKATAPNRLPLSRKLFPWWWCIYVCPSSTEGHLPADNTA